MHAVSLMFDGRAPVIVNKQPRMVFASQSDSGNDMLFNLTIAFILMRS